MTYKMTDAELTFVKRMAFHVAKSASFEEAGKAVLADDGRVFNAIMKDGGGAPAQ